jgi:predicted PurR-regulated permease PerM
MPVNNPKWSDRFLAGQQPSRGSPVTPEQIADNKDYLARAVEASIHIGLVALLLGVCLVILRPFLLLIAWGVIVSISVYPGYRKLQRALGGRDGLAAAICTLLMLAILIVPLVLLGGTLVHSTQNLIASIKDGNLTIPPPPQSVGTWPIIGRPLNSIWSLAATNLTAALDRFMPQIKAIVPLLVSASADLGLTALQFVLSILVAGVLLAKAKAGTAAASSLFNRLFGNKGSEFEELTGSTIRSVTTGILGVAVIQSFLATLGFVFVGLPGAGVWAIAFLIAAVLQLGVLVLVPAVIYVFAVASMTKAVIFLVWCAVVGLMDNVLKPMLLGRGVAVPVAVIFLGAIGGFVEMGLIGLFIGAIVLSVGYRLFLAWLENGDAAVQQT